MGGWITSPDIAAEDQAIAVGGMVPVTMAKGCAAKLSSKKKICTPTEQPKRRRRAADRFIAQAQYESIGGEQQRPEQQRPCRDHSTANL